MEKIVTSRATILEEVTYHKKRKAELKEKLESAEEEITDQAVKLNQNAGDLEELQTEMAKLTKALEDKEKEKHRVELELGAKNQ